jgi:hypothetical protein
MAIDKIHKVNVYQEKLVSNNGTFSLEYEKIKKDVPIGMEVIVDPSLNAGSLIIKSPETSDEQVKFGVTQNITVESNGRLTANKINSDEIIANNTLLLNGNDVGEAIFSASLTSEDYEDGVKLSFTTLDLKDTQVQKEIPLSDTKVKMKKTNPSASTHYCIPFAPFNATNLNEKESIVSTQCVNDGIGYSTKEGTATDPGGSYLILGNAISTGTVGAKYGVVRLYSENNKFGSIVGPRSASDNITWRFPNESGNIALVENTLPISGGQLTGDLKVQEYGVKIGKNTTDKYGYIDLYYKGEKCGNIFGNSTKGMTLQPIGDNAGRIGGTENSFSAVYARTHIAQQGNNEYGRIFVETQGTASTEGVGAIYLGNKIAKGVAGNSSGQIRLYGSSTGHTTIIPTYNSTSNITLELPAKNGTIALTDDIKDTTYSKATDATLGLVKTGFSQNLTYHQYPVKLNTDGQMYVELPLNDYLTRSMEIYTGVSEYNAGNNNYPLVELNPTYGNTFLLEVWSSDGLLYGQKEIFFSEISSGTADLIYMPADITHPTGANFKIKVDWNDTKKFTFYITSENLQNLNTSQLPKLYFSIKGFYSSKN